MIALAYACMHTRFIFVHLQFKLTPSRIPSPCTVRRTTRIQNFEEDRAQREPCPLAKLTKVAHILYQTPISKKEVKECVQAGADPGGGGGGGGGGWGG